MNNYKWPQGDTHFEQFNFLEYQIKNRTRFLELVTQYSNWCQEPPMMTVNTIDTIIDIGAHVGTWSLPISDVAQRVYAYEPLHYATLEHNIQVHGATNIISRPVLLSKDRQEVEFYTRTDNSGDSGIGLASAKRQAQTMTTTTLDLQEHHGHIQGIKIDVQGHELEVLLGAEHTIREHTPVLCIEMQNHPHQPEIEQLLDSWGYSLHERCGKDWLWINI